MCLATECGVGSIVESGVGGCEERCHWPVHVKSELHTRLCAWPLSAVWKPLWNLGWVAVKSGVIGLFTSKVNFIQDWQCMLDRDVLFGQGPQVSRTRNIFTPREHTHTHTNVLHLVVHLVLHLVVLFSDFVTWDSVRCTNLGELVGGAQRACGFAHGAQQGHQVRASVGSEVSWGHGRLVLS